MISDSYRDPASLPPPLRFLAGGGEATRLILERDWVDHPLGPPAGWPEAFKATLSTVLNSPESMILCWGRDDLSFFFNETYFPLLGPRVAWAMGAPFDTVWADAVDQARPIIDDAFAGRSQRFTDLPWKLDTDRGPADTWFTFSYSRILDAQGEVAGLFILTNETTDRVLADRRLAHEMERQRLSLQQMPGFAAVLAGPNHVFDYVNDAYVVISGQRDFIGRSVRDVFPELVGQGFYELLDGVYSSGRAYSGSAVPIHLAGEDAPRSIDLLYQPIRDGDGTVVGIFVGGYDVTEQVRAQQALAEANATLEHRIADALQDRDRIEEALRQAQKMEAVGQLTGGLAHDFNNLLTGMMGNMELLQRRIAAGRLDGVDRFIAAAQGAGQRAASLTQRLLAFSRRQTLDPRPTDVNRLIAGIEDMLRRTVGPTTNVETVAAPDLWIASIDAGQLENALLNLSINARDAMPDGGWLTIETANRVLDERTARARDMPPGDYLSISVTDTGTGMTAQTIERAFEPFFTTKPIGAGTGLGLSMVYGFARQSRGQVCIESESGHGTTICIYLPRHDGEAALPEPEDRVASPVATGGETILIVDDETTIRHLVDEVLDERGYTVIGAGDGAAALKVLQSDARIDLLVTDVGLPGGMNGRQVADAARAWRPDLKVLFITGYADNATMGEGQLDPGMALLTKPFTMDAIAAKVAEMMARGSG